MAVANVAELRNEIVARLMQHALRVVATQLAGQPKVGVVAAGVAMGTVPAGKTNIVIELDNAAITAASEKLLGQQQDNGTNPT